MRGLEEDVVALVEKACQRAPRRRGVGDAKRLAGEAAGKGRVNHPAAGVPHPNEDVAAKFGHEPEVINVVIGDGSRKLA